MTVKERIMDAATILFLEHGIHGTSTKAIITEAGVSNGALFNHFANKDELLVAIYKRYKAEYREVLKENLNSDDGIRKFLNDYWNIAIKWSLEHPIKKKFLLTYALQPSVESCMKAYDPSQYDFLIPKIKKSIAEQEILADNLDHFTFIFAGITDGIVNYINYNPSVHVDEVIAKGYRQFWRSIVNF